MLISRKNSLLTCLRNKPGIVQKVFLKKDFQFVEKAEVLTRCQKEQIPVNFLSKNKLDDFFGHVKHQNIGFIIKQIPLTNLSDFLKTLKAKKFQNQKSINLLALNEIMNVNNMGAIIRSCYAFGIDAVIVARHRQASFTEAAVQSSSGAILLQKIITVTNLNQAIITLKKAHFFFIGATSNSSNVKNVQTIHEFNFKNFDKKCLILGNEKKGLNYQVAKKCDYLITINLKNNFDSLNVAVAGGILIYYMLNS